MKKEETRLSLTCGYLMSALDEYLTPGREGFFADHGRKAFLTNDAGDINLDLHSSFLPAVTALAIEKGIPAEVVERLYKEASARTQQILSVPGGLAALYALGVAQMRKRKAENN